MTSWLLADVRERHHRTRRQLVWQWVSQWPGSIDPILDTVEIFHPGTPPVLFNAE
jgi:hypothetical protein